MWGARIYIISSLSEATAYRQLNNRICDHKCSAYKEKRTESVKTFSVLFLSVGTISIESKTVLKSTSRSDEVFLGGASSTKVEPPSRILTQASIFLALPLTSKLDALCGGNANLTPWRRHGTRSSQSRWSPKKK